MDNRDTNEDTSESGGSPSKEWHEKWIEDDAVRREQFKLIYDYIKFHIGLYLSTPAVIGLLGRAFGAEGTSFKIGLTIMIGLYLVAGVHAAWFMGAHINTAWNNDYLVDFADAAFSKRRRILHHWLYWLGLTSGLMGLLWAKQCG